MFESEHEVICYCQEPESGLRAIIAIHSMKRGPALGGTRVFPYRSDEDALSDVLELSRAMTWKAAAAELPFGGAKAVILADPADPHKRRKLKAFCKFINLFEGNFQTGEDIGVDRDDMLFMRQFCRYVHCSKPGDPEYLDTSALTARGVLRGIEAAVQFRFGTADLRGRTIAIQGLGKVGTKLAHQLRERGPELVVADVNQMQVDKICSELGCRHVDPDQIFAVQADVFSPCAVGHVLNGQSVSDLKASIVAGCANNQLAAPEVADLLHQRNILYAPDYVINAGGLISAMLEMGMEDAETMIARIDRIGERLLQIFRAAQSRNLTTLEVADQMVREQLK